MVDRPVYNRDARRMEKLAQSRQRILERDGSLWESRLKQFGAEAVCEVLPSDEILPKMFEMGDVRGVARQLREHHPEHLQERVFSEIFSNKLQTPNGEKLAAFLTLANNINWQETSGIAFSSMERLVEEHLKASKSEVIPVKVASDVPTALRATWNNYSRENSRVDMAQRMSQAISTSDFVRELGGHMAMVAVLNMVPKIEGQRGLDIQFDFLRCAQWIVLEDIMTQKGFEENPFKPLVELHKKGLWPIGVFEGNFLVSLRDPS